ncbi:hypothetical protein ACTXM3_17625 [Glutamicibacter arilaitensis]|uniref:hypothetical protein n=1 Tax=Glutamicibacter arilaitensis TaxID=256701 RepID=UPI003FCF0E4E
MSAFEPQRIRRIGVAVEMESGELVTFYADSPGAEMQVEKHVETERYYHGADTRLVITDTSTDITISGLRQLSLNTRAIEATAQAIEKAKAITEGNEK